ncbi:MAG: type II secretion system F family protein [Planctomycetaceae bacterium]|nr:type II secretion system F family protein [Planctomycetaceae bacterium]
MLTSKISTRQLALMCRSLSTSLHAGVDVIKSFRQLASKAHGRQRTVLEDVCQQLKTGEGITAAFRSQGNYFPELFCDMIDVAEQTGNLPEVLHALAQHYENNLRLWRAFLSQITMPAVQLLAAICIIGGLIYLLGWISSMTGQTMDILGWGLIGAEGAAYWFGGWAMGVAAAFLVYKFAAASLTGLRLVHRSLLGVPVLGHCMRSFAIARFSWAFHLTQDSGMPIDDSLEASLKATGNGAFISATQQVVTDIEAGGTLTDALAQTELFPLEFIHIVEVGETSGTVPETLDRLSGQFEEDARRSMSAMAMAAGWLIWAGVATFVIVMIFKLAFFYLSIIDGALQEM